MADQRTVPDPETTPLSTEGARPSLDIVDDDDDDENLEIKIVEAPSTSAASSVTTEVDDDKHLERCYLCTRPFRQAWLVNSGCRTYPKWRCKPCHAAVRVVERSAASEGEVGKNRLSNMKKAYPERFAQLVQHVRIAQPGEAVSPLSIDSSVGAGMKRHETQAVVKKVMREAYSQQGLQELDDIVWLNERQFKAHYKLFEDYSSAEAEQKWLRETSPGSTTATLVEDGVLHVAVKLPKRLSRFRTTGSKRSFMQEDPEMCDENPDDEVALKKLRGHDAAHIARGAPIANAAVSDPLPKKGPSSTSVGDTLAAMAGDAGSKACSAAGGDPIAVPYAVQNPGREAAVAMGLTKVG